MRLDQQKTAAKLLDAAGETFAEMGFQNATVREICRRARANIAADNYHYGDKGALYEAVLAHTAQQALDQFPIGGGVPASAAPEIRLEVFVRNYLERMLHEGRPAWFGKLLAREMTEPTRALDKLAETFARPQFERLRQIVTELLGPAAEPSRVRMCCTSVVGQCLVHKLARPMIERLMPEQKVDEAARAELARHITAFSLAGIRALRERAAAEGSGS